MRIAPSRCPSRRWSALSGLALAVVACGLASPVSAAVAVLTNHTSDEVAVEITSDDGRRDARRIPPGESVPFFSTSPLTATLQTANGPRAERLAADSVYRLATSRLGKRSGVVLRKIALAGDLAAPPLAATWRVGGGRGDRPVSVWLYVDEEEPMRDALWKDRLARRIAKASELTRRYAGVRLEVAGYETWRSDDRMNRFEETLFEFEREVKPPKGSLAIGFTSQYRVTLGRNRLGGTRGPLRSHILLREWSPRVGEAERLELLVHELGHYLGAAHSPEPTSVMRPVLGDRPVRLKDDVIRFDPINTLAIAMIGEEVRGRGVTDLAAISPARRERLQRVYTTLAAVIPQEPAGEALLRRLAGLPGAKPEPAAGEVVTDEDRVEVDAAAVVSAITRAAAANRKRSFDRRLQGEELTDSLVRVGAKIAQTPKGLLLGLGIALDDVGGLKINPRTRELVDRIESDVQRRLRLNVLGPATARGRHDILKHFVVSAALVPIVGKKEADLWGVGKELADASRLRGSGYSFADLAADRAGVRFAERVLAGNPPLESLAQHFRVANYVPPLDGLEEGLKLADLLDRYGGQGDPRYDAEIAKIDARIDALPAYSLPTLDLPVLKR